MKHKTFTFDTKSYQYLIQWMVIAISAGIIGCLCTQAFVFLYRRMIGFLSSIDGVPLILWPAAGALITGLMVYRLEPRAKGEGIPSYLVGIREKNGRLSFSETFFKFWAALLTLGTFGNGGFLGPVGRASAGIMSGLSRIIPKKLISLEHTVLYPVCGLAAAFAALVHSPIGAGIFAVEIIQKANMHYRRLFPAIIAATVSVFFSRLLGFEPVISFDTLNESINVETAGILFLISLSAGFLGKGFIFLYSHVSRLFHRDHKLSNAAVTVRVLIGSVAAFGIAAVVNPHLIGVSSGIFPAIFSGDPAVLYGKLPAALPLAAVLVLMIAVKLLANSLTVGSGMSAGFTGPSMVAGLLLGALFAALFRIPSSTPEYYAMLAAGFAGVISSTMNTPIAAGVLTVEMFGLFYSLPAGLASVIGFQVNRHNTLYDMVLEEEDI